MYEKIILYIDKVGVDTLPHYLSNFAEHNTRTMDIKLKDVFKNYIIFYIDFDESNTDKKYITLQKTIAPIRFKDSMDHDIFCEICMNISQEVQVKFYTDDDEFEKKMKRAYALLEKEMQFDHLWLKIIHTRSLT